ncbi:MAG TPA: amidohydrolase [Kineosporiaceae bacterium]|nr:amidohydrolase [Kineosporiaceae bacterium]
MPATVPLLDLVVPLQDELIEFRRDLHAHPEVGRTEFRTTQRVSARLQEAGLKPVLLPGTGLVCDIGGRGEDVGPTVALRADLDALPLPDETGVPYASTVPGVSHACGHDVHTATVLGAGLVLARLDELGLLPGRVRLVFQPAEEIQPGGALSVIAAGGLDGVERAYALHCDPGHDVGVVGTRPGPITSAADMVLVRLEGRGGHTSRPHLAEDVVFALAQVAVQVPAVLSRRVDPRAGLAMVWGRITAGAAPNAIPRTGELHGTLRCLDAGVWTQAGALVSDVVHEVARPYGVRAEVVHTRGVPPTVNDPDAVLVVEEAVRAELGEASLVLAEQSLGGEDFSWMLEKVPGAMIRLGTRVPGGRTFDLHQGDFTVDERCVAIGARVLAAIALGDLASRD